MRTTDKPPTDDVDEIIQESNDGREITRMETAGEGIVIAGALITPASLKELEVDKVRELLHMRREEEDRQAQRQFKSDLAAFQAEMPPIHKGRDVQNRYQYAAFEDIWKVARPILARHGFAVGFSQSEDEKNLTVKCHLHHSSGHTETVPFTLPKLDPIRSNAGRDVTNKAQALGSTNSYAKRYCFCNALNIVVTSEDDDGDAAGTPTVSEQEALEMHELLDQVDADTKRRCLEYGGVSSPDDYPVRLYPDAMRGLRTTIKKQGEK